MSGDSPTAASPSASSPAVVACFPAAIGAALSISAAARQTGITVATLRMWQTRYGLGPSLTTPGGHRRYTTGDIERLQRVTQLLSAGLTTSEAVHAVRAAAQSALGLPPDADPAAQHLGSAALELDGPTARRLLRDHLRRGDVSATWEAVLRPVLVAIGDRWSQLRHGIAMEHLLSYVATELLGHADDSGPSKNASAPTPMAKTRAVVLACVPGELHELPLVVLGAALNAAGIAATRLDAPTVGANLDEAVARHPRPVLALHAMTPEPADPTLFDRFPTGTTPLALGPGWHPHPVPPHVAHVNSLAAALDSITSLVTTRRDAEPGADPANDMDAV
jgi:MerR family transcriptional regulator, light-induced transcriptional regulator